MHTAVKPVADAVFNDVFASGGLQKMVRAYRPNVHFQDVDQCIPQHVSAGEDQERAFGWFPQGPDSGVE